MARAETKTSGDKSGRSGRRRRMRPDLRKEGDTTVILPAKDLIMAPTMNPGIGRRTRMDLLWWAIIAFIIAVIAGAMGFTGVASGAKKVAKILFFIFLAIAIIVILMVVLGVGAVT